MALLQNSIVPAAAASDEEVVTRSLRFDGSAYLEETLGSSSVTNNGKVWTIAMWVKLGAIEDDLALFHTKVWPDYFRLQYKSTGELSILDRYSSQISFTTTAKYRDPSAWHHVTAIYDSTSSTSTDRMQIWVNGVRQSGTWSGTTPQNRVSRMFTAETHRIGTIYNGSSYVSHMDGYLADVYGVDGSAVEPIGNFIEANGWGGYRPKAFDMSSYSGNSFHIDAQPAHDAELLIQSAHEDGGTVFEDSAKGHSITRSGNTQHKTTAGNPFDSSGSAIYFDGSGDYLTVPTHADLKPESGDFTVEAWINYSSIPDSSYGSVIYGVCGGAGGPSGDSLAFMLKPNGHLGLIYGDTHYTGSSSTAMSSDTWYHVALVRSSGTVKLYIDGDEDYSATHSGNLNNTTDNRVGARGGTPMYFDGYIYDLRFTKGEARYTSDFTPPTAPLELNYVAIGGDQSGNKNHFNVTNLASSDVVLDRPTNNYATLNPLERASSNAGGASLSQGNTMLSTGTSNWSHQATFSTIYGSGQKTYFECRLNSLTSTQILGVYDGDTGTSLGFIQYYTGTGYTQLSSGYHIIRVEIDPTQGASSTVKFYSGSGSTPIKSHTYDSSTYKTFKIKAYPITDGWGSRGYQTFNFGADSTFAGAVTSGSANASDENGNGDFYYSPPSGYLALCTANLDDPTVTPSENFEAVTYSGTGSAQNITTEFQPSLTWVKRRNSSANHILTDSERGANKALNSNTTSTEDTSTSLITALNSTSFGVGTDSKVNASGGTYVGWNWRESATAGFDIVTYDGDGVSSGDSQSVSHSLGVAPDMIIVKARDGDAASDYYARDNWYVWHKDLATNELLFLNTTASAEDYSSTSYYSPISSVGSSSFTVKNAESYNYDYDFLNWGDPNGYYSGNIERYVAYLFSGVEGFSKFGKYTGNGSSDGPFIYCGFRPAFVMHKEITTSSYDWVIHDTARDTTNDSTWNHLIANQSDAENGSNAGPAAAWADIVSNGWKLRTSSTEHGNGSGKTYIYAAFAEQPFSAPSNAR